MPGRAGRGCFERGRYGHQPKNLSLKPPLLPFSPPNLTNNPFYLLGRNLFNGETFVSTIISSSAADNSPLLSSADRSSLSNNGRNLNNGNSTMISVQNPQDSQTSKTSTREVFLQFYARQKKQKIFKNKKFKDKLNQSSHSLRAQTKETSVLSSTSSAPSAMSVHSETDSTNDEMQRFLRQYLRFHVPISKIQLSPNDSDMEVDETPFEVPPDDATIVLFQSLVLHMRKKLQIYNKLHVDEDKQVNIATMTDSEVADAIFDANVALIYKENSNEQNSDDNMQDADSELGDPLDTQASGDTQRTSTHDRNKAPTSL